MKKLISSALVLALAIGAAQAQTAPAQDQTNPGKHMHHRGGGFEQLNLTDAQKSQFKSLFEAQHKEMEALKSQSLSEDQSKERRQAIMDSYRTKMRAVLTTDQQAKFDAMKKEHGSRDQGDRKDKFKEKGGDWKAKGKGFDGAKFKQELNLSNDQEAKMTQLRKDMKPKFEGIRADQSLTEDQKRAKYHELMKSQQEQMKSILTPEQLEKMKSMHKEHGGHKAPAANTK